MEITLLDLIFQSCCINNSRISERNSVTFVNENRGDEKSPKCLKYLQNYVNIACT